MMISQNIMIVDVVYIAGLLPDSVPPLQTAAAVRARYGTGGHAAASGLVGFVCVLFIHVSLL